MNPTNKKAPAAARILQPVNRQPRQAPQVVQPKIANGPLIRKAPIAPPVYLPVRNMVQRKITPPLRSAAIQMAIAAAPDIESIKAAFPVLGTKLQKEHDKIQHVLPAGTPLADLVATYRARLNALKMFRQAILANGMNGASAAQNKAMKAGEDGHIQQLVNLGVRIAAVCVGPPVIPLPAGIMVTRAAVVAELKEVTLKKNQAK